MKYLLVVFAAMVLSLLWLGERYKHKAKELETAKTAPAAKPAAASVKPALPATKTPPAATDQAAKPAAPTATTAVAPTDAKATPPAAGTVAATSTGSPATAAPTAEAEKPPAPPKDWQQICYNASMQAEHAMRRRMDGALAAEVTNIGNQTDPEYRDNLQGVMNQVNTTPVTSDFAQQQLEMDNIKSSTYNNCMAGHR